MMLAPILLFVYNRPAHAKRAIEALLHNTLAAESELFIYSDAARSPEDCKSVNEVRSFIHSVNGFKKVHIIEREKNYGLARSIIDGVTTQVNAYGRTIVLEDDLVTAPYFLQFMNSALEMYKDEPRIGHIQACDFTQDPSLPDTFLDFNGKYGYTRMLRRQTEGKNNSWAIRWNASLFLKDILSLNVGKSLIQNNGFDGSGTNCGGGNLYASNLYMKELPLVPITPVVENLQARQAYVNYYARTNSFMAKAIRRIKRTLKGDFGA